jgi:hypothetical protein
LGSTWITTHILEEQGKVRKDKPFFRGSQTMSNMDMDSNIPCRKSMSENKWSFSGPQSMGSEKKYLSGHSRNAALGGRDYPIFGNNLLPILHAADRGFPYFAERQACLYINIITAQLICTAPL